MLLDPFKKRENIKIIYENILSHMDGKTDKNGPVSNSLISNADNK